MIFDMKKLKKDVRKNSNYYKNQRTKFFNKGIPELICIFMGLISILYFNLNTIHFNSNNIIFVICFFVLKNSWDLYNLRDKVGR